MLAVNRQYDGRRAPRQWLVLVVLLLAGTALLASVAPAQQPGQPPYCPDAVIVAFRSQAALPARAALVARLGLQADATIRSPHFARLRIPPAALAAGATAPQVLTALQRDPLIRFAEPDYYVHAMVIPDDPFFGSMWGLHNTGQSGGAPDADIDAPDAWDQTPGSKNIIVAVIDSGVDTDHMDLSANILRDAGDHVIGYDFYNDDDDPDDDFGHGTHVAGTIGAVGDNGVGITGVCQNVSLMPVKFLNEDGSGEASGAVLSIDFAIANGAHIINASWGGSGPSNALREAILRANNAGILFVAAAGNASADNDIAPVYPASFQLPNVLSVAATTRRDELADFSNFGKVTVHMAAPGESILSALPGNRYGLEEGTSMATAHVSGTAALILALLPDASVAELKDRLLQNVDRPAALDGKVKTGRLNANRALTATPIYSIRGRVTDVAGGIVGVEISTDQGDTTVTAAGGLYEFDDLAGGTYLVTPTFGAARFGPASRTVTVGPDVRMVDFGLVRGRIKIKRRLRLGKAVVNATRTKTLRIKNKSPGEQLEITVAAPDPPFGLGGSGPGTMLLPPKGSYLVEVTFTPDGLGRFRGELRVDSSDPSQPTTFVRLSGRGK